MIGYLHDPADSDGARRLFDENVTELGYVMNFSRLWAYQPELVEGLFGLMRQATAGRLDYRTRAILVAACASAFGDSYCSLAWGRKLAAHSDPGTAAAVLTGADAGLSEAERALAGWARAVARDPNATGESDVAALSAAGWTDAEIFAATVFVALRIALSTVNDALGVHPDAELAATTPAEVRAAVTFGRAVPAPAEG
jgi:alkylhydroperoxidase family enzyme